MGTSSITSRFIASSLVVSGAVEWIRDSVVWPSSDPIIGIEGFAAFDASPKGLRFRISRGLVHESRQAEEGRRQVCKTARSSSVTVAGCQAIADLLPVRRILVSVDHEVVESKGGGRELDALLKIESTNLLPAPTSFAKTRSCSRHGSTSDGVG